MAVLLVHSRAKSRDGKYLSTFTPFEMVFNGEKYPSVENAFQAAKLSYACGSDDNIAQLRTLLKECSAKDAKALCGKNGFKKYNLTLDTVKWNRNSVNIMKGLIHKRSLQDVDFRVLLKRYDYFYHFERSGKHSFWGGCFRKESGEFLGGNMYGKILSLNCVK